MQNGLLSVELLILPACRMYGICRYMVTRSVFCTVAISICSCPRLADIRSWTLAYTNRIWKRFFYTIIRKEMKSNDNFQTRTAPWTLTPEHMDCIHRFPLRGMHLPVSGNEGGDGSGQRCFFSYGEF